MPVGSPWSKSRSACCAANAWIAGSTTPTASSAKSPHGRSNETTPALASNGCSQPKRPALKWAAPIPSPQRSHNHCAEPLDPCQGCLEAIKQPVERNLVFVAESNQCGGRESSNRLLHTGPGRGALAGQANTPAATVVLVLDPLDPIARFKPVEDDGEILPADVEKFHEILDRHAIAADERSCKGAQHGPLLRRGSEFAEIAGALLMHQVRRLIEAKENPIGDIERAAGFYRCRSQCHR